MKGTQTLNFKTNALLKSIIGKDLINDDNIAILELVKNSYDANSKNVLIVFDNIKNNDDQAIEAQYLNNANKGSKQKVISYTKNSSKIVIQDFGVGMDKDDISDKWLNIAYSEKKTQKKQFNRILAGAKGVGRFSCDRLGEYLNIYSRKRDGNIVHLLVDWKKFDVESNKDFLIQDVDVVFNEMSPQFFKEETGYSLFEHGTILEINKLRSKWTSLENDGSWSTDKLKSLKRQLEKLINPNQAYVVDSKDNQNIFNIELIAKEFIEEEREIAEEDRVNGQIRNKIFEKLNFKATCISSEISDDGSVITTSLQDKGITIFRLVEKNIQFVNLVSTSITLYYMSPYSKAYFTRQMGMRPIDFGSIYLFINGFRISPYGEDGDDWLKIDMRKGQGYSRFLGTREVIGRVEILDETERFKAVSSREGLVRNESYIDLAGDNGFFYKIFKRLERYVVDGISWDSLPEEVDGKEFKKIEKRILEDVDWKEEEEVYKETNREKFNRVYSIIHSVIAAKAEDVISLYINEDIIRQKALEEREIVEQEYEKLLEDFSKDRIGIEVLNRILEKKALFNKDLQSQLKEFAKYSTEEVTTKAILELEALRDLNVKHEKTIKGLVKQIEQLEEETQEKDRQIIFHQKLLTHDLEQLLEFHHNIGISASAIDGHLINLRDDLMKGKEISKDHLLKLIENVSYETNKITSITNLATAANFNADTDEIEADLEDFVKQYIDRVKQGRLKSFSGDEMTIKVSDNTSSGFKLNFKPLEIAIIIDNLLSNSRKARATEINILFEKSDEGPWHVIFSDNGIGIRGDVDKIFEFGVTTTSGSGMGLYHIRKILNKYGGGITANKDILKGAEFQLTFQA